MRLFGETSSNQTGKTDKDEAWLLSVKKTREENSTLAIKDQITDIYLLQLQSPRYLIRYGIWATAFVLIVFILWAALTTLDEVTTGTGKVVTTSREQMVQVPEAGIISELLVKEGELVDLGQALVRIDDVKLGANMQESQARMNGLQAASIRLKAESVGSSPIFPSELSKRNPQLVKSEQETFLARKRSLDTSIAVLQQNLKVAQDEMKITEPLAARGLVSEIEVLRILRTVSESRGKIIELQTKFRSDASSELTRIEGELGSQSATLVGRTDAFQRTVLRSPKRGVVKNMRVNTLGAVVQSGQDIMEIVPVDDTLLIETRIRPVDIAFLHPGLLATVKITAYDSGIYGWLDGELIQISPDTLRDEIKRDETYYKVLVRTKQSTLKTKDGKVLPIIAGMQAFVDIKTGQKSVLTYLFKPIFRAREALRER